MKYVARPIRSAWIVVLSSPVLTGCVNANEDSPPVVTLSTELGDIQVEVYPDQAPPTSARRGVPVTPITPKAR